MSRDSTASFSLSMASTGRPNSGGSQFFLNVANLDWFSPGASKHAVIRPVPTCCGSADRSAAQQTEERADRQRDEDDRHAALDHVDETTGMDMVSPSGFQGVTTIAKTREHFRMLRNMKGRFTVDQVDDDEIVGLISETISWLTTREFRGKLTSSKDTETAKSAERLIAVLVAVDPRHRAANEDGHEHKVLWPRGSGDGAAHKAPITHPTDMHFASVYLFTCGQHFLHVTRHSSQRTCGGSGPACKRTRWTRIHFHKKKLPKLRALPFDRLRVLDDAGCADTRAASRTVWLSLVSPCQFVDWVASLGVARVLWKIFGCFVCLTTQGVLTPVQLQDSAALAGLPLHVQQVVVAIATPRILDAVVD